LDTVGYFAFWLIVVLATAMVYWYFYWRKRMLKFMRDITVSLEGALKPRDKTYTLLGYLVGFRAVYELDGKSGFRRAYVLLLLLPRHSLLYYPIAKLITSRVDRLDIALESAFYILRDIHAVAEGWSKLLAREGLDLSKLYSEELECSDGSRFRLFYRDSKDRALLADILCGGGLRVLRFSSYPAKNLVYISIEADPGQVGRAVEILAKAAKRLSKP